MGGKERREGDDHGPEPAPGTEAEAAEAAETAEAAEALVCMKDNVEVDAADPRCLHPSSQCRFREGCLVVAKVREIAGSGHR